MANLQAIELLVINDRASQSKPGSGWKIRLVQWVKDGKTIAVKLECGEYYIHAESGETRFKAKGFGIKDLDACGPHMAKVRELMKNPPPIPVGETQTNDVGF